jgi:hypothetical protein
MDKSKFNHIATLSINMHSVQEKKSTCNWIKKNSIRVFPDIIFTVGAGVE